MVWLIDCYDRPGQSAVPDFLPRLPAGTRVIRACDDTLPDDWTVPSALVLTGSAAHAYDDAPWIKAVSAGLTQAVAHDVPVLGVCFGHQLLGVVARGAPAVQKGPAAEVGWVDVTRSGDDPVLGALPEAFGTFVSHEDEVIAGPGLTVLASSGACAVQALRVAQRRAWGVQFHLETHAVEAARILRWRAARHPEQGMDVEAELGTLHDTSDHADALFTAFLHQAGIPFGPCVEAVSGGPGDAMREHLARVKHDLGKYVCFQQRWLGPDATPDARRAALEADLLHTRRGPDGSVDALTVWADFRPSLLGQSPLAGEAVDLALDPDVARLDGAMRCLAPIVDALREGMGDDDLVARGSSLASLASDACRRLVERTRTGR